MSASGTNPATSRLSDRRQFWVVLIVTVGLAIAASQLTARWLGFRSVPMIPFDYGAANAQTRAFAASSSLGYYGLDWGDIATNTGWWVRRYDIPGASPCEMEVGQELITNVTVSVMVISAFDMDEGYFSNFRCALAPLGQTVQDLKESQSSWAFTKRTLSHYPEYWLQKVFPTAGSAMGVFVGLRAQWRAWSKSGGASDKAVLNGSDAGLPADRISTWNEGRLLRNAATLNAAAQGVHFYGGPKYQSLLRMLNKARARGQVYAVVMPVSPEYRRLFGEKIMRAFEDSMAGLERDCPGTKFVRLDRAKVLNDDSYFWDLVHLNVYGRPIATRELEQRLRELAKSD
jgi:hypothetical protein